MNAIILAAGQAKRLRPITDDMTKCMLPIAGTTIIDHQITLLKKNGVKRVIIVVGYHKEKLIEYVNSQKYPLEIVFIENPLYNKSSASYGLWLTKEYLQQGGLYLNGDVFFHPMIIQKIIKSPFASTTAIQRSIWDEEEVNVILNKNKRITHISKEITAEKSCGEFIGVTKFSKKFAQKLIVALDQFVKNGELHKYAIDGINVAIQKHHGDMYGIDVTKYPAIEIDTPEDYERAQLLTSFYGQN